jgi:hypothetical protein
LIHRGVFPESKGLSFAEIELRNIFRESQAIIADLGSQRVVMSLNVGCAHVEVNLNEQGLSHINVGSLYHLLSVEQLGVIVVVGHEKLLIFGAEFVKSCVALLRTPFKLDVDLRA